MRVDESLFGNKERVNYCKQFKDKWRGFCDNDVINEPLHSIQPASSVASSVAQNTGILIFADANQLLSLTLETVFRQPDCISRNVLIFYFQEQSNEIQNLAKLFLFKSFKINSIQSLQDEIQTKIEAEFAKDTKQFLLIFGNLILTADFLNYFNQLIPLLWYPNSNLQFISAWNDNCFNNMCTNEQVVMRVKVNKFNFKHALAAKYDSQFFVLLEKLIHLNSFNNQSIVIVDHSNTGDALMPDFPRIIVNKDISDLFLDERNDQKVSLFESVKINQLESLYTEKAYERSLIEFKENSLKLDDEDSLIDYLQNRHNNTRYFFEVLKIKIKNFFFILQC